MAGKQKGKLNVSDLDFGTAWNKSGGRAEVTAASLNMTVGNVYTRVNKMRKSGFKLVEPAGRKPKDIASINALLEAAMETAEQKTEAPQE